MTAWVSFGQSPKQIQAEQSLGQPMIRVAMSPRVLVIAPPQLVNRTLNMNWAPVASADIYHAFIGTNMTGTNITGQMWVVMTTNTSATFTLRVPDDTAFFYGVCYSANTGGTGKSYYVRLPDYDPNAMRISATKPSAIQSSNDLRSWRDQYPSGPGPWTNMIQFDRNEFYRAVNPMATLVGEPLRLRNGDHYGR